VFQCGRADGRWVVPGGSLRRATGAVPGLRKIWKEEVLRLDVV
jgi:hypothetical protein